MNPTRIDAVFPRYREYDPTVPVWCLTPDRGGCIHRFFDTPAISPSGEFAALFRFPREDRAPLPGDVGEVVVVELESGRERSVAQTAGWEAQMGANINWGADDHALFFNDVDTATWTPFAWKADILRGTRERMAGTVYHASPDGQWLVSSNMTNTGRTQPGYGVWEKGGHHGTWFPDGRRISMNLAIDRECLRLVQVNADGSGLRKMRDDVVGSGHPTVHPNGRFVLTDSYAGERVAYGDGTVPLRWIDLETGAEEALVRINVRQPVPESEMRIDPHPAWDRSWRYVVFNGFVGGSRRVFLADLSSRL